MQSNCAGGMASGIGELVRTRTLRWLGPTLAPRLQSDDFDAGVVTGGDGERADRAVELARTARDRERERARARLDVAMTESSTGAADTPESFASRFSRRKFLRGLSSLTVVYMSVLCVSGSTISGDLQEHFTFFSLHSLQVLPLPSQLRFLAMQFRHRSSAGGHDSIGELDIVGWGESESGAIWLARA